MSDPHFSQSAAQAALLESIAKSFNNSEANPDILIKCGREEFLCHKQVLCRQSEWFQKACHGSFKEAKSHTIELHDENPEEVEAMLRYCYSFNYSEHQSPVFHVWMFALAEKYFVQGLAQLATDRFTSVGVQAHIQLLTNAISEAHATVYDQGNMLRVAIADVVVLRGDSLLNGKYAVFDALMEKHPSLAADIARAFAKAAQASSKKKSEPETKPKYPVWKKYRCPDACGVVFEALLTPDQHYNHHCDKGTYNFGGGRSYYLTGREWEEFLKMP